MKAARINRQTKGQRLADKRYNNIGKMMHRYMEALLEVSNKHFVYDGEEVEITKFLVTYNCTHVHVNQLNETDVGHECMLFFNGKHIRLKRIG